MGPLETVESSKAAPGAGQESGGGQPHRKSRWWVWLLFLAVLGYGGWRFYTARAKGQAADPPAGGRGRAANLVVPVVVATAASADLPIYLNGLGSVTAFNTVTIHSRVDGQLVNGAFAEGQIVHEGDVLAQMDAWACAWWTRAILFMPTIKTVCALSRSFSPLPFCSAFRKINCPTFTESFALAWSFPPRPSITTTPPKLPRESSSPLTIKLTPRRALTSSKPSSKTKEMNCSPTSSSTCTCWWTPNAA